MLAVAVLAPLLVSRPATAIVPTGRLPDLSPAIDGIWVDYEWIGTNGGEYDFGPAVLSWNLNSQNLGAAALDLRPDDPAHLAQSPVSQCIAWLLDAVCAERVPVDVTWDEAEAHYRFNGYAVYELRRLDDAGHVDFSAAGLLASRARGVGCFLDEAKVDDDPLPPPRYALYGLCNPVESGISPGWADVQSAQTEEQNVPLDGIEDGRYGLVVTINASHSLRESRLDNNRLVAVVEIEGKNTPFPVATIVSQS